MGRADLVRRAMSKKKMEVMEEERQNFIYGKTDEKDKIIIEGAIRNGVDEKSANKIYDLMIDFANYAFNKSHSAAYAVIAYRTAWLKYYYPVEFMAAQISSIMGNTNTVSIYIQECKRLNIEVLPPHINYSYHKFTVYKNNIRFGLSAIKNVGENLITAIINARKEGEFISFTDFIEKIEKVDSTAINKRGIESLIKSGAMDELGANRAQLLAIYEKTIDGIHQDRKRNLEGQFSLFETEGLDDKKDNLPDLKEFPKDILLSMEKEILGIYISGHPLEPYEETLKKVSNINTSEIFSYLDENMPQSENYKDGKKVRLGGIISEKKNMITKNNNMMSFIKLEDMYGIIECIIFPRQYEKYNHLVDEDGLIILEGKLNISEVEDPKIICEKISPLHKLKLDKLYIKISKDSSDNIFEDIKPILKKYPGDTPVYLYLEKEKKTLVSDRTLWVERDNQKVIWELETLLGKDNIVIS